MDYLQMAHIITPRFQGQGKRTYSCWHHRLFRTTAKLIISFFCTYFTPFWLFAKPIAVPLGWYCLEWFMRYSKVMCFDNAQIGMAALPFTEKSHRSAHRTLKTCLIVGAVSNGVCTLSNIGQRNAQGLLDCDVTRFSSNMICINALQQPRTKWYSWHRMLQFLLNVLNARKYCHRFKQRRKEVENQ